MTGELTPDEVRAIVAKQSPATRARQGADVAAIVGGKLPKAEKVKKVNLIAPYRSKWEWEYAQRLDVLKRAGVVIDFLYERDTLVANGGTKYTPDFWVHYNSNRGEEYHEVKGREWPQDKVRMRECAAVSPFPILLWKKERGEWVQTRMYKAGSPTLLRP